MSIRTKLPLALYSRTAHLNDVFQEVANHFGDSREIAERLFQLLPQKLQSCPAFFLRLTNTWCYEFGEVFHNLPEGKIVYGSEQFPQVEYLYRSLRAIEKHFESPQLDAFLKRIGNEAKHLETLGECAPLTRIRSDLTAKYEVAGYGQGNYKIDWLFTPSTGVPVLLEVKYRIKDLIKHLSQIIPLLNSRQVPIPELEPTWLFENTVEKFIPRLSSEYLQGVWIHSHVQQDESKLLKYFDNLDATRLHFAILCRWRSEAYILSREGIDKDYLYNFFDLKQSKRFVFERA